MDSYAIITGLFSEPDATIAHLESNKHLLELKTRVGETALLHCVVENRMDLVAKLLGIGADINTKEGIGATPLTMASGLGYNELAVYLIENGADIDSRDNIGRTGLSEAVGNNNRVLFDYMIAKCRKNIQYYFSDVDAMGIIENPDNDLKMKVIKLGLRDPFDA